MVVDVTLFRFQRQSVERLGVTDVASAHATMAAISKWLETLESCRLPLTETPEVSDNLMRAKTQGRSEHAYIELWQRAG